MGLPLPILVVDDDKSIRIAICQYLRDIGYDVDGTPSLLDAVALIHARRYELVITDLRFGRANPEGGLELLRHVRQRLPGTPIILVTAYRSYLSDAQIEALDVEAVLTKPVPLAELAQVMVRLLGRQS